MQFTVHVSIMMVCMEDLDVSLCVEWLQVIAAIRSLTEDNHEHCAVALGLYEKLAQGHTVVGEANASQHSIQLVTPSDMPTPDSSP